MVKLVDSIEEVAHEKKSSILNGAAKPSKKSILHSL